MPTEARHRGTLRGGSELMSSPLCVNTRHLPTPASGIFGARSKVLAELRRKPIGSSCDGRRMNLEAEKGQGVSCGRWATRPCHALTPSILTLRVAVGGAGELERVSNTRHPAGNRAGFGDSGPDLLDGTQSPLKSLCICDRDLFQKGGRGKT